MRGRTALGMVALAALCSTVLAPVDSSLGARADTLSPAEAAFVDPSAAPLMAPGTIQFANPPFTNSTNDVADPWGVGWNPNRSPEAQLPIFQGRVEAITRQGDYAYIGGMFHRALSAAGTYEENARHLVRAHWDTGQLDTSWLPAMRSAGPHETGEVWDFASFVPRDGVRRLVVVGDFTAVGDNSENATYLAIFRLPDTGPPTLDTTMFSGVNVTFDGPVHSVGYDYDGRNHVLYVGGLFTSVTNSGGARPRGHLAKLRLVNGTFVLDTQWRPRLDDTDGKAGYQWASKILPVLGYDRVIIGGFWTIINGRGRQMEKYLAAVSKATGEVQPWEEPFNNTPDGKVQMNSTEWVSDFPLFDMVLVDEGGVPMLYTAHGARNLGVKWNAATGQRLWYWWSNGDVQAVTYLNGKVYFGFHGDLVAPAKDGVKWGRTNVLRRGLWVVAADGSSLDPYGPAFRGVPETTEGVQKIWALLGDGHLYVGGDFITVNDLPVEKFAIF